MIKRTSYIKNMRKSLDQVIICLRKIERFLSCNFFLDVETTFHHTFLSSELHCVTPRGDSKNLCVNTRIRLLVTHSLDLKRPCHINPFKSYFEWILFKALLPIYLHCTYFFIFFSRCYKFLKQKVTPQPVWVSLGNSNIVSSFSLVSVFFFKKW